jgi:hypothetical protein
VHFPAFPVALVAAYAWRKIRLVCDNGRLHTTQAVMAWLGAPTEQIAVYWLPPYHPSLSRANATDPRFSRWAWGNTGIRGIEVGDTHGDVGGGGRRLDGE